MIDFQVELDKLTYKNLDHNKKVLIDIGLKIKEKLQDHDADNYILNLYKADFDQDWIYAQYQAALNQIEKLTNNSSKFNEYYSTILTESDWMLITQELIYDLHLLNQITHKSLELDGEIQRDNYLSSHQFFLHAKFGFFTEKHIVETTNRNFNFSMMPTLIRQAIEIKIKNMIGLEKVTQKNGRFKIIPINSLLDFFERNDFISIGVPISTLKSVNTWTNTFVHTGITPFCWQSLEAIDLIEACFSIKDEESGSLHLHGFSRLKHGKNLHDIQNELNEHFDANFTLNERSIEGKFLIEL